MIQLRESQPVRIADYQGIGIGNVNTVFYYRRADKHVSLFGEKRLHRVFQFVPVHLTVTDDYARLRHDISYLVREFRDSLHPVVQYKYLTAARQLSAYGVAYKRVRKLCHVSLNGYSRRGRSFENAYIPYPAERHIECSRYGSRRQGQHVDVAPEQFEFFLVLYAETLFLVLNDEPQIEKFNVFG